MGKFEGQYFVDLQPMHKNFTHKSCATPINCEAHVKQSYMAVGVGEAGAA